jgi:hypothetical protein
MVVKSYAARFFSLLWGDSVAWARDNIFVAGGMMIVPAVVVFAYDPLHALDWGLIRTTCWTYLVLFAIYAAIRAIKTVWKLDAGSLATIKALETEIENFKLAIESAKPQFKITIKRAILDSFYERGDLFVNVRVVNTSGNTTTIEKVILKNHENGNTLSPIPFGQRSIPAGRTHFDGGITEIGEPYWNRKKILDSLTDVLPLLTSIPVTGSQVSEGWLMFPSSGLKPSEKVSLSLELEDMHGSPHESDVVQIPIEDNKVFV